MHVHQNRSNFLSLPESPFGYLLILLGQIMTEKIPEAILEPEGRNVSMATMKFHIQIME
jgi:hypothetical protein